MKTKSLPMVLMLVAGTLASILGLVYRYDTLHFCKMLLTVLVVFYVFGCIVKGIIDKNFAGFGIEAAIAGETEEMKENIESESDKKAEE